MLSLKIPVQILFFFAKTHVKQQVTKLIKSLEGHQNEVLNKISKLGK